MSRSGPSSSSPLPSLTETHPRFVFSLVSARHLRHETPSVCGSAHPALFSASYFSFGSHPKTLGDCNLPKPSPEKQLPRQHLASDVLMLCSSTGHNTCASPFDVAWHQWRLQKKIKGSEFSVWSSLARRLCHELPMYEYILYTRSSSPQRPHVPCCTSLDAVTRGGSATVEKTILITYLYIDQSTRQGSSWSCRRTSKLLLHPAWCCCFLSIILFSRSTSNKTVTVSLPFASDMYTGTAMPPSALHRLCRSQRKQITTLMYVHSSTRLAS
ncbi:hypothetical protein IWX90DRAFT_239057 [Phyllosticta citrichinensis]|uniref:Uncharacterized protein n=1 Tax=Phyllosticta citrichinensis TaxID=1130410 RepID=A0ABR1XPZ1_9PEZI